MKIKSYEKSTFIKWTVILLTVLELLGVGYLSQIKMIEFSPLTIITAENENEIVLCNNEIRKRLYKNTYIYYKNHKYKYERLEEKLKGEDSNPYHEIKIELEAKAKKVFSKEKTNVRTVYIINKKENMIDVIRNTWDGDKNS